MDQDQIASARQPPVGRPAQEGRSDFDARRRVLRGAVGLPAIVTLASGSAASAASILNCAVNQEWALYDGTDSGTPPLNDPGTGVQTNIDGAVYYNTNEADHPVRYQIGGQLYLVDPDGTGGVGDVPVVPSCYSSFVATGDV